MYLTYLRKNGSKMFKVLRRTDITLLRNTEERTYNFHVDGRLEAAGVSAASTAYELHRTHGYIIQCLCYPEG